VKAISLWQPWATAIAVGSKRIETRDWSTAYRGLIAIHAAKRLRKEELLRFGSCWNWCGALAPLGKRMGDRQYLWDLLPFGAIVATARLVDCRPTDSFTQGELDLPRYPAAEKTNTFLSWTERQMGDFVLGRFGWVLEEVQPTRWPIPYKGAQGLFNVPDELLAPERRVAA
jgi:hypothetical protein